MRIRSKIRLFQQKLFRKRFNNLSSFALHNRISKFKFSEFIDIENIQYQNLAYKTLPTEPLIRDANNFSIELRNEFINEGKNPRHVGWWLLLTSLGVLGMILVGGYTRLSKSGLSMVRWKPVDPNLPR
jgi:hypothetical protein